MADALSEAQAESAQASADDVNTDVPSVETNAQSVGEQATPDNQDNPATDENGFSVDASGLEQALIDTAETSQNESGSGVIPGSDDFWNLELEVQTVSGPETVSIKELQDGYLRQADYTRKTQAVSNQTKHVDKAVEFLDTFEKDPATFIRSLAVQAGFMKEGDGPVLDVDIVPIPTQEVLDARVDELVNERINSDPRVKDAELSSAQAQVDAEFTRLEGVFNVPLSEPVRESMIQEAIQRNTSDLESLLARRILNAQQKQSKTAEGNLASTSRPGSLPSGASVEDDTDEKFPSMREAWAEAKLASATQ